MKLVITLFVIIVTHSVIVNAQEQHGGRFVVIPSDPVIKIDTDTGKTWRYSTDLGLWMPIRDVTTEELRKASKPIKEIENGSPVQAR